MLSLTPNPFKNSIPLLSPPQLPTKTLCAASFLTHTRIHIHTRMHNISPHPTPVTYGVLSLITDSYRKGMRLDSLATLGQLTHTSLMSWAPAFSTRSSRSIARAMDTPSLMTCGVPYFCSSTTFRPGVRVRTASTSTHAHAQSTHRTTTQAQRHMTTLVSLATN